MKEIFEDICCWIVCGAVIITGMIITHSDIDLLFLFIPAIYLYKKHKLRS